MSFEENKPPIRVGGLTTLLLICDICGTRETIAAASPEDCDAVAVEHGWVRFGPSGEDHCHKCRSRRRT